MLTAGCDVIQLILLLFGMEFLWRKSGELLYQYGYGTEYEVYAVFT